jgi:hypothetical protein
MPYRTVRLPKMSDQLRNPGREHRSGFSAYCALVFSSLGSLAIRRKHQLKAVAKAAHAPTNSTFSTAAVALAIDGGLATAEAEDAIF